MPDNALSKDKNSSQASMFDIEGDPDVVRTFIGTHSPEVRQAVTDFFDDCSTQTIGGWKRQRSS